MTGDDLFACFGQSLIQNPRISKIGKAAKKEKPFADDWEDFTDYRNM